MLRVIKRIIIVFFVVSAVFFAVSSWKTSSVRDENGPEITMDTGSVTVSVDFTEEELLAGVTATDNKDGDVTASLVVQDLSNFIEKGRRKAVIAAFDSDNNVTKVTREVVYSDYVSPRFSLEEPLRYPYTTAGVSDFAFKVIDCLDGDITSNLTVTSESTISSSMAGEYEMLFKISNSAGDVVELPVTMEFYDSSEDNRCPKVVLGEYLVYVNSGDKIKPWDYVEGIQYGGSIIDIDDIGGEDSYYSKDDVQISNPVDTSTPGVYEIVYIMENDEDYQSKVRLIVVVE